MSVQFRHQCEVRWLLRRFAEEGKPAVDRYYALVQKARGDDLANRLLADTREQYARGNRGEGDDWRAK